MKNKYYISLAMYDANEDDYSIEDIETMDGYSWGFCLGSTYYLTNKKKAIKLFNTIKKMFKNNEFESCYQEVEEKILSLNTIDGDVIKTQVL